MNVLITGGSKGIGRATALRFAEPGNKIFINYAHDDNAAEETAAEVNKKGGTAILLKADVGKVEEIQKMMERVKSEASQLNLIVHCAVLPVPGKVFDISHESWMEALKVGSLSLIEVVREALPILKEGSTIIALSSKGADYAIPKYAALGTPKALTESIIRYMAAELAPKGIRANTVAAGPLDTDALRTVFGNADKLLESAAKANPSNRDLTFDDITNTIAFLASPEAHMIQGRIIFVDGGLGLR
ncbi:SDR family oxidoreductase [Bacillus dakarensis]|uniref:SDR family oxidoreductase n=1 Tax=Robertmurraya dakarensis TaxID=1926278 RepID=UPI0009809DD4|nr:SDR family oxidoreductase [Bacillus dakarensis]